MKVKRLSAVSLGHFSIDVLNSSIAMVLTYAAGLFDMSVSQIGFGAMVCTLSASLTQPLFGMWADRLKGRWLGAAGLLWTATFYAMAPFMPTYWTMVACLALGALGSGALHPVGILARLGCGRSLADDSDVDLLLLRAVRPGVGSVRGRPRHPDGRSAGRHAVDGAGHAARSGPHVRAAAGAHRGDGARRAAGQASSAAASNRNRGLFVAVAFVLSIALRSATMQSYMVLLPKYFDDLGYEPAIYGAIIGVLTFGGALGTIGGGDLGDTFNRRMVIFIATVDQRAVPARLAERRRRGAAGVCRHGRGDAQHPAQHPVDDGATVPARPQRHDRRGSAGLHVCQRGGRRLAGQSCWPTWWAWDTVLTVLAFFPIGAGICALTLPSTRQPAAVPETSAAPTAAD